MSHPSSLPVPTSPRIRAFVTLLAALALLSGILSATPASAAPLGTGAISVKGPAGELLPGATIEIRKNTCTGPAVWRTTTGSTPQAYGAFGIGLEAGDYCVKTLAAPPLYGTTGDQMIRMQARPANWFTIWLPGPVHGAVVAKDSYGYSVDGVTATIREGACAVPGRAVWSSTTANSEDHGGGFGISLRPGTYCTTTESAPFPWGTPAPVETVVTARGPAWITLWLPYFSASGTGDAIVPIALHERTLAVQFTCDCPSRSRAVAWTAEWGAWTLVDRAQPSSGTYWPGIDHYDFGREPSYYRSIDIDADGAWSLRFLPLERALTRLSAPSGSGAGDALVLIGGPAGPNGSATWTNEGSGVLEARTTQHIGAGSAVEVVGPGSQRVPWAAGLITQVRSDGGAAWSYLYD